MKRTRKNQASQESEKAEASEAPPSKRARAKANASKSSGAGKRKCESKKHESSEEPGNHEEAKESESNGATAAERTRQYLLEVKKKRSRKSCAYVKAYKATEGTEEEKRAAAKKVPRWQYFYTQA